MDIQELKDAIRYEAIKMRFNVSNLDNIKVKRLIDSLMNEGLYYDEFLDIIDTKYEDSSEDFIPIFESLLKILEIEIPENKDEAVWLILKKEIGNIADQNIDPIKGLQYIMDNIYYKYDFHSQTKKYLGDSHGISKLIGLYWGYDDMLCSPQYVSCNGKYGKEAIREMKNEIIKAANDWASTYL